MDPQFSRFGGVSVDLEVYTTAIETAGQFMTLNGRSPLEDDEGNVVRDTLFAFTYMERAFSDNDYVDKLKSNEVVDEDFIFDVLAVDFTRPLWSTARCGLLDHVPADLKGTDVNAADIKQAMITSLEATENRTAYEDAFLTNLQTEEDTQAHKDQVDGFFTACDERDKAEFMLDVLRYASVVNAHFLDHSVSSLFEFPGTLAQTELSVSEDAFLDPETCVLTDSE